MITGQHKTRSQSLLAFGLRFASNVISPDGKLNGYGRAGAFRSRQCLPQSLPPFACGKERRNPNLHHKCLFVAFSHQRLSMTGICQLVGYNVNFHSFAECLLCLSQSGDFRRQDRRWCPADASCEGHTYHSSSGAWAACRNQHVGWKVIVVTSKFRTSKPHGRGQEARS